MLFIRSNHLGWWKFEMQEITKNIYEKEIIFENKINYFFNSNIKRRAIFFDRDGVLIKDMHYLSDPNNVFLEKGVVELMQYALNNLIPVFIVTNQSGISRKLFTWNDYIAVTKKMMELIGKSNPIVGIYSNSYLSLENNAWRKPNPGMIIKAANKFKINLKDSILVGDRLTDLKAGLNAGIGNLVHLLTGHGLDEREEVVKFINADNKYLKLQSTNVHLMENLLELFEKIPEKKY